MKKVYLLLRNNHQTGPFTIDELLQQQLKPADLIWAEGTNIWRHPFEMDEFSFTISKNENAAVSREKKNVHLRKKAIRQIADQHLKENRAKPPIAPPIDMEQKAEELRRRALNYHPSEPLQTPPIKLEEDPYAASGITLPHDNVRLVFHKERRRSVDLSQPITFILIAAWLGAVWYKGGIPIFNKKADPVNGVATQMVAGDMHTAAAPSTKAANIQPAAPQPVQNVSMIDSLQQQVPVAMITTPKKNSQKQKEIMPDTTAVKTPIIAQEPANKSEEKKTDTQVTASTETPIVVAPKQKPEKDVKEPIIQPQASEEKKGGFLKNLFKKKKKEEQTVTDTSQN